MGDPVRESYDAADALARGPVRADRLCARPVRGQVPIGHQAVEEHGLPRSHT